MDKEKSKEYDSVDLTEDEDSSGIESPFHFVDCSGNLDIKPPTSPLETATVSPPKEKSKQTNVIKTVSKFAVNPGCQNVQTPLSKKVQQFSSIQIKPPSKTEQPTPNIPEGEAPQQYETVTLDSDNESESINHISSSSSLLHNPQFLEQTTEITLPEKDTIYSPKQPPGKVVIIKKNNKYYKIIIPHNVMPNISKSMGPVLINIPEVGPLVISNDPQTTKFKTQQLSLNLDDVEQDPAESCESVTARKVKEDLLRDKRFCWTFNTFRKRDLEGFSTTDRLGFNKTEAKKARMCEKAMNSLLTNLRVRLINNIDEYEKFNKSLLKKDKIKLVKINSIIRASREIKKRGNKTFKFEGGTKLKYKESEISTSSQSDCINKAVKMEDYDSDLLVTKKVVILNNNNKEVKVKRELNETTKKMFTAKQKGVSKVGRPKRKLHFKTRPCLVQISRDKRVEEAYVKYCEERGLNATKTPDKPTVNGLPPKFRVHLNNPAKRFPIPHHSSSEKEGMLLSKIICSESDLEKEMVGLKPFLIVTEETVAADRSLEYYCNEFSKNNVVFVVNSKSKFQLVSQAEGFVSAVEIGYIKLVDSELFAKFALNGMTFRRTEMNRHCAEHNYSLVKK